MWLWEHRPHVPDFVNSSPPLHSPNWSFNPLKKLFYSQCWRVFMITVFIQYKEGLENKLTRAPLLGLAKSIYCWDWEVTARIGAKPSISRQWDCGAIITNHTRAHEQYPRHVGGASKLICLIWCVQLNDGFLSDLKCYIPKKFNWRMIETWHWSWDSLGAHCIHSLIIPWSWARHFVVILTFKSPKFLPLMLMLTSC